MLLKLRLPQNSNPNSAHHLFLRHCRRDSQPPIQPNPGTPASQPTDIPAKGKPGRHDLGQHEDADAPPSITRPRVVRRSAPKSSAPVPETLTLDNLQRASKTCKACDLWKLGTQTVFGEGPSKARLMFVGEQPGDYEDRVGHPFVGPAGRLLDEVLAEVGIDRSEVYVTNVVKHFKWEAAQRGKRRIHKKPRHSEIEACRPWLDAELKVVKPEVLVCLGASAAQALLGKDFRVTRDRGTLIRSDLAPYVMATTHPASVLRAPDSNQRERARAEFIDDLKKVADLVLRKLRKAS